MINYKNKYSGSINYAGGGGEVANLNQAIFLRSVYISNIFSILLNNSLNIFATNSELAGAVPS